MQSAEMLSTSRGASPNLAMALDPHLGILLRRGVPSIVLSIEGFRHECAVTLAHAQTLNLPPPPHTLKPLSPTLEPALTS